jgi:hypothetical protein
LTERLAQRVRVDDLDVCHCPSPCALTAIPFGLNKFITRPGRRLP